MNLISNSGGFFYHYLYLRNFKLWKKTQEIITNTFANSLPKKSKKVLFLGASSAYMLDFKRLPKLEITLIDPDPLAGVILSFRSKSKIKHIKEKIDFKKINFSSFDFFYVGSFLGQNIQGRIEALEVVNYLLKNHPCLIHYDLYSFSVPKNSRQDVIKISWEESEKFLDYFSKIQAYNIVDHETDSLFQDTQKLLWEFKKNRFHVVALLKNSTSLGLDQKMMRQGPKSLEL